MLLVDTEFERMNRIFQESVVEKRILVLLLFATVIVLSGCRSQPERVSLPVYDRPLPAGEYALRKITDPYEIPDFTLACDDLEGLREALANSLNYLNKASSRQFFPINGITRGQAVDSLKEFAELLDSGLSGVQLDASIREKFDVYMSVGCDNRGTVLFTGYYTPIFDGSLVHSGSFQYPLYKQPNDLVKGPNGEILGRRGLGGGVSPYPPRAVIEESNMLAGTELIWLSDPFEAYVAHVQGSAKVRLDDGRIVGVGYAASNGLPYRSISEQLVADGVMSRSQISLSAMMDYFRNNTARVLKYTRLNQRYVFFHRDDGPPRGSLNEPVTAMRSVATDKSIFPRGCLTYFSTTLPQLIGSRVANRPYSGFALDQDTGGAIRAPGRCDIYMGEGEMAGRLAGQTYQEGRLYYLFLK
jgi:membrane-bound lytic murein transglycosylase A